MRHPLFGRSERMRTELTPVRVKILLNILKMEKNELSAANIAKKTAYFQVNGKPCGRQFCK